MVFNGAQFHMLVNHLPVIGFVVASFALFAAIIIKNIPIMRFVLGITVVAGLSALPALWTGEPAEETVEHLAGVGENLIHDHEEAAELATVIAIITAFAAGGALLLQIRQPESLKKTIPGVLALSVLTTAAMGYAAHQGGMIRHPEIRADQSASSTLQSNDHDENEEEDED